MLYNFRQYKLRHNISGVQVNEYMDLCKVRIGIFKIWEMEYFM